MKLLLPARSPVRAFGAALFDTGVLIKMVQTSSPGTAFRPIKMVAAITRVRLDFDRLSPPAALVAVSRHAVDDVAKHLEELPENPFAHRRP
jgi:hypothetical protein